MRKTATVLTLFSILIILTTFNPNNLNFGFHFFKIKKIEVKNVKILKKNNIENQFYNELSGSSLFILDEKRVEKILNNNNLIDYLEFKKIFPYKLQIIVYEKETIAILNYKRDKSI